jgi:hypothetical protein
MMPRIYLDTLTNHCQRIKDNVKIIAKSIIKATICPPPYLRYRTKQPNSSAENLKEVGVATSKWIYLQPLYATQRVCDFGYDR